MRSTQVASQVAAAVERLLQSLPALYGQDWGQIQVGPREYLLP
jgi:hypothetical protein